jgi:hypothetical protein
MFWLNKPITNVGDIIMEMEFIPKVVLCVSLLCLGSAANAVVLNFEGFSAGQIIDDEYSVAPTPGVTISAVNLSSGPNAAIIFDTNSPTGGDSDLGAPFNSDNSLLSDNFLPGNVLIIQETNDCNFITGFCDVPDDEGSQRAGEFEFIFNNAVTLETLDFFDIESGENSGHADSEIHLYDASNSEIFIGSFFVPNTNGDNKWNQLDFGSVVGVKRMVIEMKGSGAIDNLVFTAVPIPATVWLFGSGLLGLIGIAKKKTA